MAETPGVVGSVEITSSAVQNFPAWIQANSVYECRDPDETKHRVFVLNCRPPVL